MSNIDIDCEALAVRLKEMSLDSDLCPKDGGRFFLRVAGPPIRIPVMRPRERSWDEAEWRSEHQVTLGWISTNDKSVAVVGEKG